MIYPPKINPQKEVEKITTFIKQTFVSTEKGKALVPVSGGIDSATSLFLTARALGPENVLVLYLPAKSSDPIHLKDAKLAVKTAHIPEANCCLINIGSVVQKTWRIINHYASLSKLKDHQLNRLRLANLMVRIRMLIIYDQAKALDALVVGTENRSEYLLGYFTRYGDEASDLEPLRQLYKTQVYDLAKFLSVPQEIISKEPSADLWPGQTDARELGFSYQEADPILYLFKQGKTESEITKLGYRAETVKKVLTQIKSTQFKHQVPYVP